jgi:hypothetical protein
MYTYTCPHIRTQVNQAPVLCFSNSSLVIAEDELVSLSTFISFSAGGSACSGIGDLCQGVMQADMCSHLPPWGDDAAQTVSVTVDIPMLACSPFNCTDAAWEPQDSFLRVHTNGTMEVFACNGGTVVVNITVTDSGGASTTKSLTVVVQEANDQPRFDLPIDTVYMLEDSVDQIPALATRVSAGRCEDSQTLTFSVTAVRYWVPYVAGDAGMASSLNRLYSSGHAEQLFETSFPNIDHATGNWSYELHKDRNGRVDFDVKLQDSGGTSRGSNMRTRTLTLYVLPVNDEPSFSLLQNAVSESSAEVLGTEGTVVRKTGAVVNIQKGGWNEERQRVIFSVEIVSGVERLFVPLRIDCGSDVGWSNCSSATGDLYAVPRPRRFGQNIAQVRVTDDGGQADYARLTHGALGAPVADNTSVAQGTITLTLNRVNQKPLFYLATDRVRVLQDSGCVTTIPGWDYLWGSACNRSVPRRSVLTSVFLPCQLGVYENMCLCGTLHTTPCPGCAVRNPFSRLPGDPRMQVSMYSMYPCLCSRCPIACGYNALLN